MSSTPPSGGRLFVEPLEARIAPTGLTGITNNQSFSTDPTYLAYATAPVSGVKLGFVNAQSQYGIGNGDVFAVQLTGSQGAQQGDKIVIYNPSTGFGPGSIFLQANAGNLVAFFKDFNGDGQVQTNELVGLALGKKSDTTVNGNVNGDVATNLAGDFSLMHDSVGKPGFKITNLDVVGNINGSVLSGGDMNRVAIGGTVHNVLAGTAAIGASYNFTGTAGAISGTIAGGAYKDGKIGASVNNLTLTALTSGGRIQAGDGGLGAMGGSVATLNIQADTDGFNVLGGAGGVGNGTLTGGTGGAVDTVLVQGVANSLVNHLITIAGGKGGDNPTGKGGVGGTVTNIFTSFNALSVGSQSADLLAQDLLVHGGDGGNGFKGGTGGAVTNSFLFGSIADDGASNTGEIQVFGGHGGLNTTDGQGKGGNGGSISLVQAQNLDTLPDANNSLILLQAGDGGLGKNGGNVDSVTLLGKNLEVNAGNGANGFTKGGSGGGLNTINLANLSNLFASSVTLNAGRGGDGGSRDGGFGGDVTTVTMNDSDLTARAAGPALVINAGNGGRSAGSLGGNGGSVLDIQLNDSGASATVAGTIAAAGIRAGVGGDGFIGGGLGGSVGGTARFQFIGSAFSLNVTAGAGGSVLPGGNGNGGGGGNLTNLGVANIPDITNFPTISPGDFALPDALFALPAPTTILPALYTNLLGLTGSATAGAGGSGTVLGGAGGALNSVNFLTGDTITMHAGDGGSGGTDAAGPGGGVNASAANSLVGSVALTAGNAGQNGAGPGAGGTVSGFVAEASAFLAHKGDPNDPLDASVTIPGNITIRAGDGHAGGAGGSVLNVGTNLNTLNNLPNFGSTTVRAGDGSDGNGVAGAGGDVTTFNGFIGLFGTTSLTAGNGGGSAGSAKVGAGGSVTGTSLEGSNLTRSVDPTTLLNLSLDFTTTQQVTLDAGSAGISNVAKQGQPGGSVTTAIVYNLDAGSLVHHVAAGNGSGGRKQGGAGGSITDVHVGTAGDLIADIGIRSGVRAGYDALTNGVDNLTLAGGLFAGVGGAGRDAATSGLNGSVVNVTANAISSIVAGKDARPQLVDTVDQIYLAGLGTTTVPRANADGSFVNFDTANLVGSVYNNGNGPTAATASTYKPGDGLIAATTITMNRNFTPEAALTFDQDGNLVLADRQQPNPTIVNLSPASVGL